MKFQVDLSRAFEEDAGLIADHIHVASGFALRAQRWLDELLSECLSLETFPERNPKYEASDLIHEYRWFAHYSHRVLYRVLHEERTVRIVAISPFASIQEFPDLDQR